MDKIWTKEAKLVVGIDIGATCSAVSYVHLTKGAKPEVQRVTEWPGQAASGRECRLPSWIWYDTGNKPVKYGAEAFNLDAEKANEKGFSLAKYFKLHLHPSDMAPASGFKLEPLPAGLTVDQVYVDYFRYLFQHTRTFFQDHTFLGQDTWGSLHTSMDVVIAHPNGWGTREQGVLRTAAVEAGWSTPRRSQQQISFVSEAEASVQFCLDSSQTLSSLRPEMNLIVCDAGGSTVDTTVYKVTATQPILGLQEVKSSACIQAGAIFVDEAFAGFMGWRLKTVDLDEEDAESYAKDAVENFTNFIKLNFNGEEDMLDIRIGHRRLNIPSIGVHSGRMQFQGSVVKLIFNGCVDRIIASVSAQAQGVKSPHIFLVGGFGDNPYLKTSMRDRLHVSDRLTTSNKPGAKAVADGAAIWAITRSVISRVTRYSFGTDCCVPYDEHDPAQSGREKVFLPSGECVVNDGWSEIVARETSMSYDSSLRHRYQHQYHTFHSASRTISANIYSTNSHSSSKFMCDKHGVLLPGWKHVCVISAKVQDLKGMLVEHDSPITGSYWRLSYRIGICFGGTQLTAFIEWDENGETHTGPAKIIPVPFK
ncbi:hypothetical protein FRC08_004616 [Ceratobasidium sp. 394]|nr:hypothetical protein FRC08_004616 [Ceratobasidium sp. 394]